MNRDAFSPADRSAISRDIPPTPPVGYWRGVLGRLLQNKGAVAALAIILLIILMALAGPGMTPYGYNDQQVDRLNLPPRIPALMGLGIADGTGILQNRQAAGLTDTDKYPPGSVLEIVRSYTSQGVEMCDVRVDFYVLNSVPQGVNYWFGTDYLGRDLWTRTWRGARVSLVIALVSVASSILIGTAYGAVAGYYGGRVDMLLMRLTEIVGAFPQTIVATLLILLLGTGIKAIILALALRGWVGTARLVRGQFLRFRDREYVLAARTLGVPDRKLMLRHILPNSIGPVITRAMIEVPSAIFAESFLAFIGLGLQAPEPSIGVLLSDGQKVLTTYPAQTLFPALLISLLMISFNLFANGLREALNPQIVAGK